MFIIAVLAMGSYNSDSEHICDKLIFQIKIFYLLDKNNSF